MIKKCLFLGVLFLILIGCSDSRSPRERLQNKLESGLRVMLPLMADSNTPIEITDELIGCMVSNMVKSLSDEEVHLVIDSSFIERVEKSEDMMRLQEKIQSPQFALVFFKQCQKEIENAIKH